MKKLIIIGARGFGRELYSHAQKSIGYNIDFTIKGFLDDNSQILDDKCDYPPILGNVEDYIPEIDDVFIVALGDSFYRKKYVNLILNKKGNFISLIHETAYIGKNVEFGTGIVICPYTIITNDIKIGNHVQLNLFTTIGHDCVIGDFFTTAPSVNISGNCTFNECIYFGTNSAARQGVTICDNVTIGMGGVVIKNISESGVYIGNPLYKLEK